MSSCSTQWPPRVVIVPGLHGSEDAHWQTWLARQFARPIRITQSDWGNADLQAWSGTIRRQLSAERGPFVLAAHSFGCLAAAQAIGQGLPDVAGVLLVAPASPTRFGVENELYRWRLNLGSIVVGSENDPWMPADGARALARAWGSAFINLGPAGHVNVASGFGPWPRAKYFIDTLIHWSAPHFIEREEPRRVDEADEADEREAPTNLVPIGMG
ncbi:alpha/beta hydrolase [Trinickia symbiotica]|uniref:Alpha/beta hydrolase n=1 Tax=Trinickia symbiotica TaxID=863227 RepID=A0A2T3XZ88_9BURK|nr:alpha/beta hydrolase [Trinickia symbiotica]PTB21834.1 alpha/beta hydrolase [Trinickia symbiotica]